MAWSKIKAKMSGKPLEPEAAITTPTQQDELHIVLGEQEVVFVDGEWIKGGTVEYKRKQAKAAESVELDKLRDENRLLSFKVQLLQDLLATQYLDFDRVQDELDEVERSQKVSRR